MTRHYVNQEPFDPYSVTKLTPEQEAYYSAPQWKLIWWKFTRHKVAVVSLLFLSLLYSSILISEFLAPYDLHSRHTDHIYAPPQTIKLFHEGSFVGPFTYGLDYKLNMTTLKREYTPNPDRVERIRFFCSGDPYEFWGVVKADLHLICPATS